MKRTAALTALLLSGCAVPEPQPQPQPPAVPEPQPQPPYVESVLGPNVYVRVPKSWMWDENDLEEAIDSAGDRAVEFCDEENTGRATYFIAARTAIFDKSEYEVTYRCCRRDDECCRNPKSKACE